MQYYEIQEESRDSFWFSRTHIFENLEDAKKFKRNFNGGMMGKCYLSKIKKAEWSAEELWNWGHNNDLYFQLEIH